MLYNIHVPRGNEVARQRRGWRRGRGVPSGIDRSYGLAGWDIAWTSFATVSIQEARRGCKKYAVYQPVLRNKMKYSDNNSSRILQRFPATTGIFQTTSGATHNTAHRKSLPQSDMVHIDTSCRRFGHARDRINLENPGTRPYPSCDSPRRPHDLLHREYGPQDENTMHTI